MARIYHVNGEVMVYVKGNVASAIPSLTELGLADSAIDLNLTPKFDDIKVNAWGTQVPPEQQAMLAEARVTMTLVHYDINVWRECVRLTMAGAPAEGQTNRAGTLMGGNAARFAAGNYYIGLNFSSPIDNLPWRFWYCTLLNPRYPIGTERTVTTLEWRAVPYTVDPWNNGLGAYGAIIWDHNLDS